MAVGSISTGYVQGLESYSPDDIVNYALSRTTDATNFITQLGTLAGQLNPTVITPVFPTVDASPINLATEAPTFETYTWEGPTPPSTFVGAIDVDALMPDAFEDQAPVISFPTPATFSETAPTAPGINFTFDDPELTLTLPAPPNLLSISVTPFEGMDLPAAIDSTIPELTVAAPSVIDYEPGALYTSTLLTRIQTELNDRILNGGTGLNADAEQAIWDRGREREYRQAADALLELERMESLGFALPPGGYIDGRIKIQTELAHQAAGHSREVMIKQAELEAQNVAQALQIANQLEASLIQNHNQVEQRSFEATKYATEAAVQIYNARVQAYGAYVDAFKVRATIYEAQIRGEMAKVEAYKAEMEAERAKAQVNTALVEQYKAQVEGALANVEVYKARIQGIQTKAQIEKLKIEVFGEQIKAYGMKVNAHTAGIEAYKAQVAAEGTKQEAFKSRVQAYSATVEAAVKQIQARIEVFKGQIEIKSQEWEGYKAQIQGEIGRATAITSGNQALAEIYKAEVQANTSYNEVLTKQWQVALDQAQRVAEIGVQTAKANAELYMTSRSLALDAAKVGSQVASQLGAAALNAVNWSHSYNRSSSDSTTESTSNSTSLSSNYNYNYNSSS